MGIFCSKQEQQRHKKHAIIGAATSKVVLITGASSGIGKASALALLECGHIVYGAARRIDAMKDIALHPSGNGHVILLDITCEEHIVRAVDRIRSEQSNRLDVLVNNAGIYYKGPVECTPLSEARRLLDVNLFGLARLTQEVIPLMRNNKTGMIINVSSTSGKVYGLYKAWYCASKHALEGWSDCLRIELAPFNIKVVIVEPGFIATKIFSDSKFFGQGHDAYSKSIQAVQRDSQRIVERASSPQVIASRITTAIETTGTMTPKRRYVAGYTARRSMFIRNWLGDGVCDSFSTVPLTMK